MIEVTVGFEDVVNVDLVAYAVFLKSEPDIEIEGSA